MNRTVVFLRHVEKDKSVNVADDKDRPVVAGAVEALRGNLGSLLSSKRKACHSVYLRTQQTAQGIVDGGVVEEDESLGVHMSTMFTADQQKLWKVTENNPEDAVVEEFLERIPKDKTWLAYDIGCGLAYSLLRSVKESATDAEPITEFKVTHSGYIEALLKYLVGEEIEANPVLEGQQRFVDKIGDIMKMNDIGCTFEISGSSEASQILLNLRGNTYPINMERLESMAAAYKTFRSMPA